MKLILDFETANTEGVDLDRVGAEVYARHPATEILCLCVMTEDGDDFATWTPGRGTDALRDLALRESIIFEAHNAAFEQLIWQHVMVARYSLPEIPIRRWSCTMARAYAHGIPGGLAPLAKALRLPEQKDKEGADLTYGLSDPITKKAWSTPQSEGGWRPDDWQSTQKAWADSYKPIYDRRPATLARVQTYCMQDCWVEWAAGKVLPELSPYERSIWEYDQIINQRGVKIDRPFVEATVKVLMDAKAAVLAEFEGITGLRPKQVEKLKDWLAEQGCDLPDLAAATVDAALGGNDERDGDIEGVQVQPDLPASVLRALELRRLLGASAIDKFPRMLQCAGPDDRVRYTIQYHGAGTGRWSGRLFQPQNFPRASLPDFEDAGRNVDPELAVSAFLTGDYRFVEDLFGVSAIKAAGRVLRHALIADEGRYYHSADFAGIEMRVDLALAGQDDLLDMLVKGESPYIRMAEDLYGRKISKVADIAEYSIGKNTILGAGFGMGHQTFHDRYCSHMPIDTVDSFGNPASSFAMKAIEVYRGTTAPKVPALWKNLENAALEAVQHRGRVVGLACGITYEYRTDSEWLICHLPDDQRMWYREPALCVGRFANPAWRFKSWKDGQWKTVDAYGGLLCENVCQKLARGLLCEAIVRLEHHGFPVVLTVHDEILAEPAKGADQKAFEQIMAERPRWAATLPAPVPIAVEGWSGPRYRK